MSSFQEANPIPTVDAEVEAPAKTLTKPQQERIACCCIGLGIAFAVLFAALFDFFGPPEPAGVAVLFAGGVSYGLGCTYLAELKGYPSDYGAIAAALLLPGMIGLLLLKDRRNGET